MTKFRDIPQLPFASYRVNTNWRYLPICLEEYKKDYNLDMNPEFQRGHVWTKKQQIAYVEWILRGGFSGKDIFFNCPGWQNGPSGSLVLVDGKQRLNAVLEFLDNKITAYGCKYKDYEDSMRTTTCDFVFHINDLEDEKDVLEWYLAINSGGTPHKKKELDKVRNMLNNLIG